MRELTEGELLLVAGGLTQEDVVVTARRTSDGGALVFITHPGEPLPPSDPGTGGGGGGTGGTGDSHHSVSVKLHLDDSTHSADAQTAAENVAIALATIEDAFSSSPSTKTITFADGNTTTVGDILNQINGTTYIVTDQDFSQINGGRGGADAANHTDTLSYTAFEGPGSYADPNYHDGNGMIGIMLHETGHMTTDGAANYTLEHNAYTRYHAETKTPASYLDYFRSNFGLDDEIFADDFAVSAARAVGLNVDQFESQRETTYPNQHYEGAQGRLAEARGFGTV